MKRPKTEELSLSEKIGQLLMLNQYSVLQKCEVREEMPRTQEEINDFMKKYQYGSLWATGNMMLKNANMAEVNLGFKPSSTEYKEWLEKLQENVRIPMLRGVDCEAGTAGMVSDGTATSTALAVGAANDEELAFELAAAVAREIKALGGNWRWTPIVDFYNRFSGVSCGRIYSDDPEKLIKLARATVNGTKSEKIASTVKHFPGCDPYEFRDPHIVGTSINISLDEWRNTQAKTFQAMIDAGVDSIMVGHISFPAADNTSRNGRYIPSTMSKKILQDILRKEMGFEGVIITDGITMSGLTSYCDYEEMLVELINAGNDVLLGVNPYDFEIVEKAVLDGRIPMSRIDESAERVLKLKEKIGLFDDEKENFVMAEVAKDTIAIDKKIAEKSITLLYDKNKILPLSRDKIKNVTIICSSHFPSTMTDLEVMKQEFEARGANVNIIGNIHDKETVRKLDENNDLLLYAAYIAPHRPMGMPSLYGDVMETYFNAFTFGKEKSIGVSMGYPYLCRDAMAGANTFFNIYTAAPESMRAFVKALYGEIEPNRESPVDLEMKLRYVYC